MTYRICAASATAMVLVALGTSQIAAAKPLFTDALQSVPESAVASGDSAAMVFSGVYARDTFGADDHSHHVQVLQDLDYLLFDRTVAEPEGEELLLSTKYGVVGLSNAPSGTAAAFALPEFDIGSIVPSASSRRTMASTAIPEPATGFLIISGIAGMLAGRRRRRVR